MITITRKLEFDAGHRVYEHEGKCATLHGHRYTVEVEAFAESLDNLGRVIDFSVLKERIGGWLDKNWDHTTILFEKDEETIKALKKLKHPKGPFVATWNPTAENMAQYLFDVVCPDLLKGTGVRVRKVVVWETPNCKALAQ